MTNKQRKRKALEASRPIHQIDSEWFGTQESYVNFLKLQECMADKDFVARHALADGSEEEDDGFEHPLVQVENGVGVISIEGSLVYGSVPDWALSYGWACGYDNIKDAVLCALAQGASSFVYRLKTGGGAVMGCGAAGEFIAGIAKKYPSVSFTDSACYSAGVWLAVSTGDFRAEKYAKVGSIGVFQMVEDASAYYSDMGIKHEIFRSTPLKGAGNGVEPMSADQKASFQKGVDEAGKMFVNHVASSLKLQEAYVTESLATAETWYAAEAKELGLVKKVQTLDQVMLEMAKKTVNNPSNKAPSLYGTFAENKLTGADDMRKAPKTIEEAEAAAAASLEVPKTEGSAAAAPENNEPAKVETPKEEAADGALVTMLQALQAQNLSMATDLAMTKVKVTDLEAKLLASEAESASAKPYLASYINGLKVRTGGSAADVALLVSQPLSTLVAYADTAKAEFHQKMGTPGQKTIINPEEQDADVDKAVKHVNAAVLRLSTF